MKSLLVLTVVIQSLAFSQDVKPLELNSETGYFDFLEGEWYREQDGKTDLTPAFRIVKGIHPAHWNEEWFGSRDSTLKISATGLRVWDKVNNKWRFVWVSDNGLFQNWEGKKIGNDWYFYHFFDVGGDKYLSRQGWLPAGENKFTRISEKSYDDGRTWQLRFKISYIRKK